MTIAISSKPKLKAWLEKRHGKGKTNKQLEKLLAQDIQKGHLTAAKLAELANGKDSKPIKPAPSAAQKNLARVTVKGAGERLSTKRYGVKRPDGSPLTYGGKELERASAYDKGVMGVFFKHLLRKQGALSVPLTEWEKSLLYESAEKDAWCGSVGDSYYAADCAENRAPASMVKAVLDDTVSGGIFLNPAILDENIVTYPLLNGQLAPYVDLQDVTARRIMLPTLANPTLTWGTSEGTAITAFNTAQMIGDIDTTIQAVTGAIELGRDLQDDSPINFGDRIVTQFGERLKQELDRVIAVGDGITQPLGIFNTSGITLINSDNGQGGPWTVSDIEGLYFGVQKQYRDDMNTYGIAFILNDVSYRRCRSIPVGPGDERRVFGMDQATYQLLDRPVRISPFITNSQAACVALKRYRLYRRLGLSFQATTEGKSLMLNNTMLFVMRARFGGQCYDAAAVAVSSDHQQ